jgi:hypothetical protein
MQMAGDLAQGPLLGPVETVNGVDLFRCEHRQIRLYRQLPVGNQNKVLFKIRPQPAERRQVIERGNILYNTTIATAIADRLVENSEIFLLGGDSLRKANQKLQNPPVE